MNASAPVVTSSSMSQWIVSLAISVICCAILFLMFAVYMLSLQEKIGIVAIKLESVEQRQGQLATDINAIRHPIQVQISGVGTSPAAPAIPAPAPVAEMPPPAAPAVAPVGVVAPLPASSAPPAEAR